jgi:5-methyltetrahydropteroyltriglutamate--homocysteine methyltransferase
MTRIRTTHTGSLPRPPDLLAMLMERETSGSLPPGFAERVTAAVTDVVRRQRAAGIDVINDGEQGKVSYVTYVKERLTGFDDEAGGSPMVPAEAADHPDWAERRAGAGGPSRFRRPACTGEVRLADQQAVHRDIADLKAAAPDGGELFMTAASPGVVAMFLANRHYPTHEAYIGAIAEAMRYEYRAIADAGITLQLDCPDLAAGRHTMFADRDLDEFRRAIALNVEALNHAVSGIPAEQLRLHVCWGNYEGPHDRDVPLRDIVDIVLTARPAGISLEGCNPRHGHEWAVFEDVRLPDDRYLIPGVVGSTNNYVEHPELIAQRLLNYARVVGAERVVAGSDCGFGTFAGSPTVAPTVTWAKLAAMAEGARIASERMRG